MAQALIEGGIGFFAGYACRSHCGSLPCQAKLASSSKPFKLSVVVHSAQVGALDGGPGVVHNQRPYVGISVGDRTKETELGDWSKEKGQWCFREIITVLVEPGDEISLFVTCSTRYNLYVAAVSLNATRLGEICFPVTAVLPWLRAEDRDEDGIVYATPVRTFEIVQDGRFTGRVYLSFETKTPPPSRKPASEFDQCCAWNNDCQQECNEKYREGFDDASTAASSSRQTERSSGLPSTVGPVVVLHSWPRPGVDDGSAFPAPPDSWRG